MSDKLYVRARNSLTVNDQYLTPKSFSWRKGDVLPADHGYVLEHSEHFEPAPELTGLEPKEAVDAGRRAQLEDAYRRAGATEKAQPVSAKRDLKPSAESLATRNIPSGDISTRDSVRSWAERASDVLKAQYDEQRAVVSGSIDIPSLVAVDVKTNPHPERILDLLVNRQTVTGNEFEFIRQTTRTNLANIVGDSEEKPESVFTVASVTDHVRVFAHLSESVPQRIFADHPQLRRWLNSEMGQGVLNKLEQQIVNGDGSTASGVGTGDSATELLGILEDGGTEVSFDSDIWTSLRSAYTQMQDLGESPNAWVISTADAEELDLERESTGGGFLSGAVNYSNVFKNLPVVASPSLSAGTALLADWSEATLYVREDVRFAIDVSGEHFQKNTLQARSEGRFGFRLSRPQAFAVIQTSD